MNSSKNYFCQAKMPGFDITLHAVKIIYLRVIRDSKGEDVTSVYVREMNGEQIPR